MRLVFSVKHIAAGSFPICLPDLDATLINSVPALVRFPYAQNPSRILHLLVRTRGAPLGWAAAVRGAILEVDQDEPARAPCR